MTTTSDTVPPVSDAALTPPGRPWARFLIAFVLGLAAVLTIGVAAMYAYDAAHDGRILPGVRIGSVDVSGLDRAQAAAALEAAYGSYGQGQLIIGTSAGDRTIAYADFDRRPDVDAMIAAAMDVGRSGDPVGRGVAEVRTVLHGVTIEPRITLDERTLTARIVAALAPLESQPVDATIAMGPDGIVSTAAHSGRTIDTAAVQEAAVAATARIDAPSSVVVQASTTTLAPRTTDAAVATARAQAGRMIADLTLADGSDTWTVPAATVRTWVRFDTSPDGSVTPVVDQAAVTASLADVAKKVQRAAVSATFLTGNNGTIVGVTASKDGRTLDIPGTADAIGKALADRAGGAAPAPVAAAVATVAPTLTSAQAEKAAPLMTMLGGWTTYFPILDRNAFGANIWLPAQFINGTVLAPGQTFDWWTVVGPVTAARGFGMGGFIAGDHTDPTGALGGGMCSSSTTLFNAALRAGLQMGARHNHTYYINRYPLGLDATVWISGSARQSMTFTNDTANPILIKGIKIRDGGKGYVRYEIWGVPDGRTVSLSTPLVKNVLQATTHTVYVTTLPPGARKQTEFPVNGMDVWVTRTVKNGSGAVIHNETYYSHYTLWNGIIQVGASAPAPAPSPAATPTPSPAP